MKSIVFLLLFILFSKSLLFSQNDNAISLSLQECIQMAVEKNINVKNAKIDTEKGEYKIKESRAVLFPKINFNGNFQDNIKLPTTMLPGELIGQPGTNLALRMGTNYNTSAVIGINQILYNQTALVALQLSKKVAELTSFTIEKASEELANEMAKLYFLTLTTFEQKKLLEANIERTEHIKDITKILVDNGMVKQVDYDRISVNIENFYTQLNNIKAAQEQQINMIKYMLDIPYDEKIILTDNAEMLLLQNEPILISDFSNHIDIQMLESQKEIQRLNHKIVNYGYLPTLSLIGQCGYQGMRSEFNNYFNNNPENKWYAFSYVGLNLSIPIFDGLERYSKSQQAKLDYKKTEATLENTKNYFNVNYANAVNNYHNNKINVQRQKQNIELAEKIYEETSLKYSEGLATMSDLLQDEIGLSSAQAGYLTAIYNFKEAELKIMSLSGEIKKIINN